MADNGKYFYCVITASLNGEKVTEKSMAAQLTVQREVNIDTDEDGEPDINIDTDGDGQPDIDIDTDGDFNGAEEFMPILSMLYHTKKMNDWNPEAWG